MDIRIRRVIMSIFFLVFFILAPILILYASGYRYDYKRVRLIRTGNIFLEMRGARNATIFINDEKYGQKLDKKIFIKNLIPDDYLLRIEKEGFFPWQKKLKVSANLTSFEKDIVLFSKSTPVLIDQIDIEKISLSPDGQTLLYSSLDEDVREVFIMKIKEPNPELIYRNNAEEQTEFYWSENGKYIIIYGEDNKTVINDQPPYSPYNTTTNIQELTISTSGLTDKLFSIEKNKLYLTDLATKKKVDIKDETDGELVPTLSSYGSSFYFVKSNEQATILYGYNELRSAFYTIAELPTSTSYKFLGTTDKWIAVQNKDIDKVYIIKRPNDSAQLEFGRDLITLDGSKVIFSHNKEKILILSENQLSLYDTNTRTVSLIERLSTPLTDAFWYQDDAHVFMSTNNSITISDLDTKQEIEQINLLTNAKKINGMAAIDEETIVFTGEIGDKKGIYLLSLN